MTKQFGKFQLLRKIATGGMAEIHIAKQKGIEGFEKIVVVKTILPDLASNREFIKMFLDEARIAARLTHPNIVQIFDLGQANSTYFITMEYVQGENLQTIARKGRETKTIIPLEHVAKIASHACEGLYYAHSKLDTVGRPMKIVHRDVSPHNILVSFEGAVKLVDFGIAKAANQYQESQTGILKGKYSYMSPEQCLGQLVDSRSDIFSMGIVLWDMATGLRLFTLKTEVMILKEIVKGTVKPPREINQRIPAELEDLILRALEKNPKDRFENAIEMHLALEKFAKNQQLTSGSVQLSAFMRELFKDKLDGLRIVEEPVRNGTLASILFDDIDEAEMYVPGSSMTPSAASQPTDPSKPLLPMTTSGISHIAKQPQKISARSSKRRILIGSLIVLLLGILGTSGYFIYHKLSDKPVLNDVNTAIKPAAGAIHISSTPNGATVFVDGNKRGTSPCDIKDLELGRLYKLRLSKSGQRPWEIQFKLKDSSVRRFHAQLKPGTTKARPKQRLKLRGKPPANRPVDSANKDQAYFSLRSEPKGAEFFLNNSPIGGSFTLAPGSDYVVSARLSGYREWSVTIKPTAGEQKVITANLVREVDSTVANSDKARLSLNSTPQAVVFVDEVNIGSTPIANHEISPGTHTIHLVIFKIKAKEIIKITANPGESIEKNVQFAKGFLKISTVPGTDVFVNGDKIGTTPFQPKKKYAGTYKVVLKNPILNVSAEKTAVIKKGKTTVLKADFVE